MKVLFKALVVFLAMVGVASAEPFKEITVGIPVTSLAVAEQWYLKFLGSDVEVIKPVPGIVEFKAAPNVWLQIYETDDQNSSGSVIRLLVEDMKTAQSARSEVGINTGEAIEIPGVVIFSEFADPFGNEIGFYALP